MPTPTRTTPTATAFLLSCLCGLAGCLASGGDAGPDRALSVHVDLTGDTCGVQSADATVTAADMSPIGPVALLVGDGAISGRVEGVPAGTDRTVTLRAYDALARAVYEGEVVVDVIAGQVTPASITLHRTEVACGPTTGAIDVSGTISNEPPPAGGDDVLQGADLAFSPSDAVLASDGTLFLFDAAGDRIRRVDLAGRAVLPPLVGSADAVSMAVTPDGAFAYLGYAGGRMDVFDVAAGTRTFFAAAPATVSTMIATGAYLFTIDDSGAWDTHSLFHRATGARVASAEWRDTSRSIVFSPTRSRVYFLDSFVSPTDLHFVDLGLATGTLGEDTDSPYHGSYSLPNPVRLLPDESAVVVGSGLVFDAADLTYRTAIGLSFTDLAFVGERIHLARTLGGSTELVTLSATYDLLAAETLPGVPLWLFARGSELVLVTQAGAGVQLRFLAP